jgi:putative endonuclease
LLRRSHGLQFYDLSDLLVCHSRAPLSGIQFLPCLFLKQSPARLLMQNHDYFVYIMASKKKGTLYIGVTNDLVRRVFEHKNDLIEWFTKKYKVHTLVHYEHTNDIHSAIEREKTIKKWNRQWKVDLIEKKNPGWDDLYPELL